MGEDSGARSVRRRSRRFWCLAVGLAAILLTGCAATVTGAAAPAATSTADPVAPPTSGLTSSPSKTPTSSPAAPPQLAVTAACPLLSAAEVGRIYNLTVGAQEGPPLTQTGSTTYNCSYVNGAEQKLAALQVVVDPAATGDPTQYLDGYVRAFLAPGANAQPVSGLGTAAVSYLKSDSSGPLAFVVATVRTVGSSLDVVQFLASTSNVNDPNALTQMIGVVRLALNRL